MMPDLTKMHLAAQEMKVCFDKILMDANIQDSGEARISAHLFLTIAEQYGAVLHLIEGGFSSHAPIVVRSMLEGLASLCNLVNDSAYLDQMKFDNARSDVILFTEYAAEPCIQDDKEAIAMLTAWKGQAQPLFDELKAKGFRKQDITEKFKKAKMSENYVAYRVFCSFAHNQLTTLNARHGGKFELRYHEEAPSETTASVMTVAVSILCRAFETLAKFTDLRGEDLAKAINEADETWEAARKIQPGPAR
jgi:hypothetical protein